MIEQILKRNRDYCQEFIKKYNINQEYEIIIENYNKIDLNVNLNQHTFNIKIYFNLSNYNKFDELPEDIEFNGILQDTNIEEIYKFHNYLQQVFTIGQLFDLESFDYKLLKEFYGL